jgi:hypothetical protein
MTDRNQFEAMLEALINEDQETAKEIFHNIVVAKSREIYNELLETDFEPADDAEEEPADDEEETDDTDVGGDATDDLIGDVTSDDEESDGEEETDDAGSMSDEEQSDKILDLEDALEELKAEFEQLMAGEEGEEMGDMGADPMAGDDMGADPMAGDDMGMDMGAEKDELESFMEYVDKVALPKHGDNGTNTKSIVAGKNDMGGTTANIAKGGESKGAGTSGGLASNKPQDMNTGNINVPGGNAGKTSFKKKETATHGDNGSNTQSLLRQAKK